MSATKPLIALVRGPVVSSRRSINNEATPCLAFACLSAVLHKHGWETVWVDAIGEGLDQIHPLPDFPGYVGQGLTLAEAVALIPAGAGIVAFSGMFSSEWPVMRELIRLARRRLPGALFVSGGEHVTALPEYSLRDCPELDVIVRGEGEGPLLNLVESHAAGHSFDGIEGLAFRGAAGEFVRGGGVTRIREIDEIPWLRWPDGYLEKFWAAGKSFGAGTARDLPFLASRGCPYRCTFCSSPAMWTTRYSLRAPEDCVAEIRHHVERSRVTCVQFYDLTAMTKRSWIHRFCELLIAEKLDVSWSLPSGTRSEVLDGETLALMKRAGCRYLVYAPESGSTQTLKRIQKQISLPKLEESVREARRLGMSVRTNLIMGFPGETPRQLAQTLRFALRMAVRGVDDIALFLFTPYPGSALFEELLAAGRVRLSDGFLLKQASAQGDFFSPVPSYADGIGPRVLAALRLTAMMTLYAVGYSLHPRRFLRTVRNVLWGDESQTVLEHRLQDLIRRQF